MGGSAVSGGGAPPPRAGGLDQTGGRGGIGTGSVGCGHASLQEGETSASHAGARRERGSEGGLFVRVRVRVRGGERCEHCEVDDLLDGLPRTERCRVGCCRT
ncbi:hypothetical protein VFPFJ_09215 [Purpureocillium lilacinum]|uniref:Uncharacterized protein n=1 Tax=Purpureocillium lilacinum TaxID=33203 RepID=A0A179GU20_PURLI|nr:hypothetical protein VFPFJ_09215 [Purpureocillium lilacinum]OAQ80761.1 hypothetical protein VFPFJ_09215 [Purpureocillium lilacinum]